MLELFVYYLFFSKNSCNIYLLKNSTRKGGTRMADALVGTTIPILFLIGTGFLSRRLGILEQGDERVLSAYVYFFALPSLFFVNMAETSFVAETLSFIFAGVTPIFVVVAVYCLLFLLFRFSKNTLYLLTLSTVFGSLAFFGIPFVTFAFQSGEGERLATLAAATIGIAAIVVSIMILELYRLGDAQKKPFDYLDFGGHLGFGCWGGDSFSSCHLSAYAGRHHICCGYFYVGRFSVRKKIRELVYGFWVELVADNLFAYVSPATFVAV
jgi:predicted permease